MLTSATSRGINADTYTRVLARETPPRFACHATDATELRAWQEAFRSELGQHLGLPCIAQRITASAPMARKRDEVTLADHVREEWELETEPGFYVPFFLLRPLQLVEPLPLVLTPHGHNKTGRFIYAGITKSEAEREEMIAGERDIALQAVRAGYIAIAPEARAFGESMSQAEADANATSSCRTWQARAWMFGRTLIGERVWDIMRLIDYAQTRDDIDVARIAITGNSGGGTTSLFAAAMDPRIGVAVPGSYFCTFEDSIGSIQHCACNYVPAMLELGEMADVAGLIAPRPFLAVNGQQDPIFPAHATQRAFDALHRIYKTAGASDRCKLFLGDDGHRYYKQPVWRFIQRWLSA